MPRVQAHAHKLKRHKYKSTGTAVFFCALPDCTFKTETRLTLGKRCICWRCGKEFIMNEYSIRLSRPHCMNCKKNKIDHKDDTEFIADAITSIATDTISDLRDRLSRATSPFRAEEDKI